MLMYSLSARKEVCDKLYASHGGVKVLNILGCGEEQSYQREYT